MKSGWEWPWHKQECWHKQGKDCVWYGHGLGYHKENVKIVNNLDEFAKKMGLLLKSINVYLISRLEYLPRLCIFWSNFTNYLWHDFQREPWTEIEKVPKSEYNHESKHPLNSQYKDCVGSMFIIPIQQRSQKILLQSQTHSTTLYTI